jgi:DEAD/DEAH box helicase domain-containing protein
VGLSAPLWRLSANLLKQTRELIEGCGCETGCPACVGPAGETGERGKQVALDVLRKLGAGASEEARCAYTEEIG